MRTSLHLFWAALAGLAAVPASGEVVSSSGNGFVSHHEVVVQLPADEAWDWLTAPERWWSSAHTYSGDAGNLTFNATPGGCFCETIPSPGDAPDGEIEHMRVVYAAPYSTLRLAGALGPLQSEGVTGALTMTLRAEGRGTRIVWDYVVGGYTRTPISQLAPAVDRVVAEQLQRLAGAVRSLEGLRETDAEEF
jgi:hypothetical protein